MAARAPVVSLLNRFRAKEFNGFPDTMLLIDMQGIFLSCVDESSVIALVDNQIQVIRACADYDIPVAVLEFVGSPDVVTLEPLRSEVQRLRRTTFVRKISCSGFEGTELEKILKSWQTKRLLLTGVYANACVEATARDAVRKGFRVAVAENLMANAAVIFRGKLDLDWFYANCLVTQDWKTLFLPGQSSTYLSTLKQCA